MLGFNNLIEIPTRVDLATQVADVIRKTIRHGIWSKDIPSERRLSELLKVSRPTIRVALHMLAKDGLLEIKPRTRKRLLGGRVHTAAPPKKTVGIITPAQITRLSQSNYMHISDLIAHLSESGFAVEIFVCKPTGRFSHSEQLASFLRANRVVCCLLLSVNESVQSWFSTRSFPALVLGSCYKTIRLPSVDVNLRASCRHAAGLFLHHGHRRLALILPDSKLAGDQASELGFREAVELHNATPKDEARITIIRHNDTAPGVTAKLKVLFQSPDAPTALLVAKPWPTFTTIIFLLKRGLAVPESVSVIARDQDLLYETIDPPISHYRFQHSSFTQRASHLVLKMLRRGVFPAAPSLILPEYFQGGTVARRRPG